MISYRYPVLYTSHDALFRNKGLAQHMPHNAHVSLVLCQRNSTFLLIHLRIPPRVTGFLHIEPKE